MVRRKRKGKVRNRLDERRKETAPIRPVNRAQWGQKEKDLPLLARISLQGLEKKSLRISKSEFRTQTSALQLSAWFRGAGKGVDTRAGCGQPWV